MWDKSCKLLLKGVVLAKTEPTVANRQVANGMKHECQTLAS